MMLAKLTVELAKQGQFTATDGGSWAFVGE
jgi:hypothetical protein